MQRSLLPLVVLALFPSSASSTSADNEQEKLMEEVLVTSQRVERTQPEVPVSLSIVTAQLIKDLRAETVSDIVKTIPNVYLQDIPGDYTYFQIRGLPRNLEQTNFPVYVDGVPYTSLYGLNISLLDVEQMEMVRGPQGNLFGSNARDGLLSIKTRQPSGDAHLRIALDAGNYNYRRGQLMGSVPLISDELYISLAAEHRERDGFVENTAMNSGIDYVDEDILRPGLSWIPSKAFSARFNIDYQERNNGAYTYIAGTPALERGDDLVTAMDEKNILEQEILGTSLNLKWQLIPDWTLNSVTGTRKVDTFARFDADLTEMPFGYYDTWLEEKDTFQELRLTSDPSKSSIDWLFGLSYFNNEDTNRNLFEMIQNEINADMKRDSWTGYANVTWEITPRWTLESGMRYTQETLDITTRYSNPLMPMPTVETSGEAEEDYNRWLPKLAISYKIKEDQVIYVSSGKGMLSGGGTWLKEDTDEETFMRKGIPVIYGPETSANLELGYKAFWPDHQTSLNVALHHMLIKDYQHFYPDAMMQTRVSSVESVRSQGIETSLTKQIWDSLTAMFSFGYSDAKIAEIDGLSGATSLTSFDTGKRVPGAPRYNGSLQLTHDKPIFDNWDMRNTLSINYFGDTIFDADGQLEEGSYPLVDLNASFCYRDEWTFQLWIKNLTDERYQIYRVRYDTSDVASYGQPQMFGLEVSKEL